MGEEKYYSFLGVLALIAFLSFLAYLLWRESKQGGTITVAEIERAREIARRLEQ